MNTTSLIYCLLGVVCMFWPLTTLFVKRNVLQVQWLMMTAIFLFGISMFLNSCMMNNFLYNEIIIEVLFIIFCLATPAMIRVATSRLTRLGGVSRIIRLHTIYLILVTLTITTLVYSGDRKIFEIIFLTVISIEMLYTVYYLVRQTIRLEKLLDDYYSSNYSRNKALLRIVVCILIICTIFFINSILYPMHTIEPVWYSIIICSITAIAIWVLGHNTYNIDFGAERFLIDKHSGVGGDPTKVGRKMCNFIESEGFNYPDLSVFDLAVRFHISQDDVVDIIHKLHGCTFFDYVDSIRIEKLTEILLAEHPDMSDYTTVERLAHRCGYLSAEALLTSYKKMPWAKVQTNDKENQ